jgi:hypothetical protein
MCKDAAESEYFKYLEHHADEEMECIRKERMASEAEECTLACGRRRIAEGKPVFLNRALIRKTDSAR